MRLVLTLENPQYLLGVSHLYIKRNSGFIKRKKLFSLTYCNGYTVITIIVGVS